MRPFAFTGKAVEESPRAGEAKAEAAAETATATHGGRLEERRMAVG